MENELAQIPQALEVPISTVMPVQDIVFGAVVLLLVMFFHAFFMRTVSLIFYKYKTRIAARGVFFGPNIFFGFVLMCFFMVHISEIVLWTTVIVKYGLVANWRNAAYYVANTYTMLGYGSDILPMEWKMVTPIIAISGLFTFGWTGSAMVNFIADFKALHYAQK